MSDLLNELLAIERACADAFNRRQPDQILSYFSEEIAGFSSTRHHRFHGQDELRKTIEYYLSEAEEVSFDIEEPEVQDLGEVAVLSFYWRVILRSGEKESVIPGRGSHVFKKTGGQWKIVHEHFSRAH